MTHQAFIRYAPLNILKPVAANVWIVDGPEICFGYAGIRLPFPTRMTVVRLCDGGLWVHSPTQPNDALLESIAALGAVRFLVAPNSLHYWWIPEWKGRFPDAEVYAVSALERSARRPVPVEQTLTDTAPLEWRDEIAQVLVAGALLMEADFFHRPSRTLILTDLIENFEPSRAHGWFLRLILQWSGVADPDGKAPFDMRWSFWRHRPALRRAVEQMIAWNPERIILAHGRWYEREAVEELKRAFRWAL
jgi:hypothetical protein